MSAVTSDAPSEDPPPRRPVRARRWPWAAVVAALVLVYVGAYVAARCSGRLQAARFSVEIRNAVQVGDPLDADGEWIVYSVGAPWTGRVFHPCIVIEEWWRNE